MEHAMTEEKQLLALVAPETHVSVPAVSEHFTIRPSYAHAEQEPEESVVPLSHYLWILRRHKWRILTFVLGCVAATVVVSSRLTPIYESTAAIDIDRQAPSGVIGQDSARMAPNDADQFLATQVKIIQSDSVLRPVAERFRIKLVEGDSVESPSTSLIRKRSATGRSTESDWMILTCVARNWSASLGAMRAESWPMTPDGACRSISMAAVDS